MGSRREWRYLYAGLEVASSLELPEWASFATIPSRPVADVLITHTPPLAMADGAIYSLAADETALSFAVPQVGRYSIRAGREIVVMPYVGADEADLRLFLLGSAWGALSYQRGWFPLHASVVQIGTGAVAFCAPAGNGKSSLAAWLVKQGYGLFSDDLCRLDVTGAQPPCVWRSTPRLKLWRDALLALAWQDKPLCRDQMRVDKFHLLDPIPRTHTTEEVQFLPLQALYVLAWGELDVQPLTGLHAVHTVIEAATYRPEFVTALGQTTTYWQRTIELARQVPIFRLQRPRDWGIMPNVGELVITHLARTLPIREP